MTKAASALLADAQRAWDAEIGRRITAIESGDMALESWDEVKQRVAKDILGQSSQRHGAPTTAQR